MVPKRGWKVELPWIPRELGRLPAGLREHWRVLRWSLRDLPRTLREEATVEMAAGMTSVTVTASCAAFGMEGKTMRGSSSVK